MVKDKFMKSMILDLGGNVEPEPNYSGFVVLGAGLPRTGTLSLRTALEQVLEGRVYHMAEVVTKSEESEFWNDLMKRDSNGKRTHYHDRQKWIQFLQGRGYRAGVDFPISLYYKDILKAFPDVKVVLSVRDPETWYESVKNSIYTTKLLKEKVGSRWLLKLFGAFHSADTSISISCEVPEGNKCSFDLGMFPVIERGKEASVKFYNKWVQDVKDTVPENQLLVHHARDGWEPLCKFIGVPIPDGPYPRVNDTERMLKNLSKTHFYGHMLLTGITLATLGLVSFLTRDFWKPALQEAIATSGFFN